MKWCLQKCISNLAVKLSQAVPVRSAIQLGPLSTPGSSYYLGNMFWKHGTIGVSLLLPSVQCTLQEETRVTAQEPKKSPQNPDSFPINVSSVEPLTRSKSVLSTTEQLNWLKR